MPLSKCAFCEKPVKDKLCSRCHSASYCSEECQKSDFPLHTLFCSGLAAFRHTFPRPADSDRLKYKLAFYFPFKGRPDFVWVPISILGKNGDRMSSSVKIEEGHLTSPTSHNFQSRERHFEVFRNDYPISKLPGPNKLIRALIRGYHHYLCNEVTQDVIRTNGPLVILKLNPRHPCRDGLVENPGSNGLVKDLKQTGYKDITLADVRFVLEHYASKSKTFESDLPNRFIIRDPSKGWVEGVKISCEGDMTSLACKKYRDVWARPSTPEEDDQALINTKMGNPRPELPKLCSISQHMGFTLFVQDTEMELSVKPGPIAFANVEVQAMMTNADPASDGSSWGSNDTEMLQLGLAPTVLVMRQDGKAISAKQVEVFVSYCKDVLRPKMQEFPKGEDNSKDTSAMYTAADQSVITTGEESWREKFIKDYMKSSKFEEFIKVFKAEKLAAGDTTWVDVVSPRAV